MDSIEGFIKNISGSVQSALVEQRAKTEELRSVYFILGKVNEIRDKVKEEVDKEHEKVKKSNRILEEVLVNIHKFK